MRTAELARRTGLNPETLRYYERIGILEPPPRTRAGYREYPDEAVAQLTLVGAAKQLGFHLSEICELLQLDRMRTTSCDTARELATNRVAELERRIDQLQLMRDALSKLADACGHRDGVPACPILESLVEARA